MLVRNTPGIANLDQIDELVNTVRSLSVEEAKEGIRRIVTDYKIDEIGA